MRNCSVAALPGNERDALNFRPGVESQTARGQRASGRKARFEIFNINLVEGGPILDVRQEHSAFDNLFQGAAVAIQNCLDIVERLVRFGPDTPCSQRQSARHTSYLTRYIQEVPYLDGLR